MADELYIDMLHDQLYATHRSVVTLTGTHSTAVGLSDFAELPGQSTWYIRSIRFRWQGYTDTTGAAVDFNARFIAGVCNRDISGSSYPEPGDYQDIAGFPLSGVYMEILVPNTPYEGIFSYTKTWKPSGNLTLNREQDIQMCAKKIGGANAECLQTMYIHAQRGD